MSQMTSAVAYPLSYPESPLAGAPYENKTVGLESFFKESSAVCNNIANNYYNKLSSFSVHNYWTYHPHIARESVGHSSRSHTARHPKTPDDPSCPPKPGSYFRENVGQQDGPRILGLDVLSGAQRAVPARADFGVEGTLRRFVSPPEEVRYARGAALAALLPLPLLPILALFPALSKALAVLLPVLAF